MSKEFNASATVDLELTEFISTVFSALPIFIISIMIISFVILILSAIIRIIRGDDDRDINNNINDEDEDDDDIHDNEIDIEETLAKIYCDKDTVSKNTHNKYSNEFDYDEEEYKY